MEELSVPTHDRTEMLDITSQVQAAVNVAGLTDGICLVHVPHTTAAVTINENADPDVVTDVLGKLQRLVPRDEGYRHAEGNSDAHVKSSLLGCSLQVPVSDGRLVLGTWQSIFFCEFDGPRRRRAYVQTVGGTAE